jgi:hypothetical protein
MCHGSVVEWGQRVIHPEDVAGRRVVEVGSYNVNGSLRDVVMTHRPSSYVGVDTRPGPAVDVVMDGGSLRAGCADVIICTEVLEHVFRWQRFLRGLKEALATGGWLFLTTRAPGFPLHEYPSDYWRFTSGVLVQAFADMDIWLLEPDPDPDSPGVFLKARRMQECWLPGDDLEAVPILPAVPA